VQNQIPKFETGEKLPLSKAFHNWSERQKHRCRVVGNPGGFPWGFG
jgi:hypothetical protein